MIERIITRIQGNPVNSEICASVSEFFLYVELFSFGSKIQ